MRSRIVLASCLLALSAAPTAADEAPFGLHWGPLASVPRPAMIDREGNITALHYDQARAPGAGPDTREVILEVCRDEGLQQVLWTSRALTDVEAAASYARIYAEGVGRYGLPQPGPSPGAVLWAGGRVMLAIRHRGEGQQLIMLARGDGYDRCSTAHEIATGHPASRHAAELLEPAE